MDILIDRAIGTDAGEISVAEVKAQLARANGQPITVRIHCEGGSVFEGLAMFDAFKAYRGPKKCIIESAAFSMASAVALAFDQREITGNGFVMLHDPYTDDDDKHPIMEKLRQRLVAIYSEGTRKAKAVVEKLMANETFLDAKEALASGFVTAISGNTPKAVARFQDTLHRSPKLRSAIVARLGKQAGTTAKARWQTAVSAELATGLDKLRAVIAVDAKYPGLRQRMIDEANGR